MSALRVLSARMVSLFTKRRREHELTDEIRAHLDLLTEEYLRGGMTPDEAQAAARRAFGGIEQVKERYRDQLGLPLVETIVNDVRYAARMLRKAPGFTAVAVGSLALGIGANSAIFSVVNAALLKDLPVEDPDRLAAVVVYVKRPQTRSVAAVLDVRDVKVQESPRDLSYPAFRDLSSRQRVFSDMAASDGLRPDRVSLSGRTEDLDETVDASFVSANYFLMLGVQAVVGRVFTPADSDAPREGAVAVISHGFWERHFGRDPSAVGRTVTLNGTPLTIVGVAPRGFFGDRVGTARDIWIPILMQPGVQPRNMLEARTASWFKTIGRLRPGITEAQANRELTGLLQQVMEEERTAGTGSLISQSPSSDYRVAIELGSLGLNVLKRRLQQPLQLLMGVVGLVLLIACCNVANLLLARATTRQREIATRLALGCSRRRLVGQLLTESLLLSVLGGAVGLLLARWAADVVVTQLSIPAVEAVLDGQVLTFTLAVSVVIAILFGLAPALQATALRVSPALQAARQSATRPRQRTSKTLVALQVALSLWLLIGAGLLARSLQNLRALDIGVDRAQVLMINVAASDKAIRRSELPDIRARLSERLRAIPGVSLVGFAAYDLFTGSATTAPVRVPASRVDPERDGEVRENWVSPEYFRTVGMSLAMGRGFADRDSAMPRAAVAVINETMARHYFGRENPLGKLIYFPEVDAQGRYVPFGTDLSNEQALEIIGVVRDAKYDNLRSPTPRLAYLPIARDDGLGSITLRAAGDPRAIVPHVRQAIRQTHANLVVRRIRTLEEQIDGTLGQERMFSLLLGFFGLLALLLAGVGLYGVMAHGVAGRTSEIGVRMALGAKRADVVAMVVGEMLVVVVLGVVAGALTALETTRLIASLLFGLAPIDPVTIGAVAALMLAVAALAALAPARRAASVDPIVALRCE